MLIIEGDNLLIRCSVSTSRHSGLLTKTILLSLSVHILLLIHQPPLKGGGRIKKLAFSIQLRVGVTHTVEKKKMKDKQNPPSKRRKKRERERALLLWLGDATSVTPSLLLCCVDVQAPNHVQLETQ